MFKRVNRMLNLRRVKACESPQIHFNDALIKTLRYEHEELIRIFKSLANIEINQGRNPELDQGLIEFRSRFQSHLVIENVDFYQYLEQSLDRKSPDIALVNAFKQDLNDVASMVSNFCMSYECISFDSLTLNTFDDEYRDISIALHHRFNLEERDLFDLYQIA